MHPNGQFHWADDDAMLAAINGMPFGRVFATTPMGPRVAHAPVIVTPQRTLRFHLANGNALTDCLDDAVALILFEGANSYISANWNGPPSHSVPTWNYVAIECEGIVRKLGSDDLVALLDTLAQQLEPTVDEDWTRAKMDPARFEAMLHAITCFELDITAIRGTRKLSQNISQVEHQKITEALDQIGHSAMAQLMRDAV